MLSLLASRRAKCQTIIPTVAKIHRSAAAKRAFRAQHPCPATGSSHGACHGYVIDYIKPLCAGGEDAPRNMQWQTVEAGKAKERLEH